MKNVKNADYLQIDNQSPQLVEKPGVVILSSATAYRKFKWTRDYFKCKPEEGYFVWVKKQIDYPLTTCITIASEHISQVPMNLVVIEEGIKTEMHGVCNAVKKDLQGVHTGYSKFVLKENSELKINNFHSWGQKDTVISGIDFMVEKSAKLTYTYRCLQTPMELKATSQTFLNDNSSANLMVTVQAKDSKIDMSDFTFLNGNKSNGISRVRMVGDKRSEITVHSQMIANAAGTGHLDCMGLLLAKDSTINAIPSLINKNKEAALTHEASVGKISEENLNYLRCRGLTEDKAIDLIVAGFLGEEESLIIEGQTVSSDLHM